MSVAGVYSRRASGKCAPARIGRQWAWRPSWVGVQRGLGATRRSGRKASRVARIWWGAVRVRLASAARRCHVRAWGRGVRERRSVSSGRRGDERSSLRDDQGLRPWTPARGKDSKTQDSIQRPGNSETGDVVPASGGVPEAKRGTHGPRDVVPRAATPHPATTIRSARPRAPIRWRPCVAVVIAVLYQLPYIPVYVVQSKRVRRKRTHRRRLSIPAAPASVTVRSVAANSVPPVIARLRPRSRHVLPLRLAQQPISLTRLPRQPPHVFPRILPAHVDDRTGPPSPAPVSGIVSTSAAPATRIPLTKRHLVHPHRYRLSYRHSVHRSFIIAPPFLTRRTAHHETPRTHNHQLRTPLTVPKPPTRGLLPPFALPSLRLPT